MLSRFLIVKKKVLVSENGVLLVFLVFLQANKVWSSGDECPQHSLFIRKISKDQQKPAAQTPDQNQNKVLTKIRRCASRDLTNQNASFV